MYIYMYIYIYIYKNIYKKDNNQTTLPSNQKNISVVSMKTC